MRDSIKLAVLAAAIVAVPTVARAVEVPAGIAGVVIPDGAGGFAVYPTGWLNRAGTLDDDTEILQWAVDNAAEGARVVVRSVNNGVDRNPAFAANAPTPIALGKLTALDMTWGTPRGSFGFFSEYRLLAPPYADPVDITKPITLEGDTPLFERARDVEGGDPLRAGATLSGVRVALHVEANGVTIRGLLFEGFTNTIMTARAGLTIEGCAFRRCFSPLLFFQDDYWVYPRYPRSLATRPDLASHIRNNRVLACKFGPYLYASEVAFTDNYVFTQVNAPGPAGDSLFGVIHGGLDGPVSVLGFADRFSRRECRNNEIARNTFDTDGTTIFAVLFSGHGSRTEGNRVVDNEIRNTLADGIHFDAGSWIEVHPLDPSITVPASITANDTLVRGNRLDGCGWDSLFIVSQRGYAVGNRFEENTITGMGRGLDYTEFASGVTLVGAEGGTIRDNTIAAAGEPDLDPLRIPGAGIAVVDCAGVTIDGNRLGDPSTGEGLATRGSATGILESGDCTIAGNDFFHVTSLFGTGATLVDAASSGNFLAHNDYSRSGLPGWNTGMGCVLLDGASGNLVVEPASFPDGTTVCEQVLDVAAANHIAGAAACARPNGGPFSAQRGPMGGWKENLGRGLHAAGILGTDD